MRNSFVTGGQVSRFVPPQEEGAEIKSLGRQKYEQNFDDINLGVVFRTQRRKSSAI
jgi:hypothetical protein